MDAVLPISGAARQFFADNKAVSIHATAAETGAPVTFDGFAIDLP